MKSVLKTMVLSTTLVLLASCSGPESKVKAALEKKMGREAIQVELKAGVDKLLGPKESKFKSSLYDFVNSKTSITFSDIKVQDKTATAKVAVTRPNEEDLGGLILLAAFVDQKKLLDMSMNEFMTELTKGSRKTASINDIRSDKYEFLVTLENNGDWSVDEKQLKNVFNKKNKVKQ